MTDSVNIRPTRLYRLRSDLCRDDYRCALVAGLREDSIYWLDGSRPSSLGGYVGTFRDTYVQMNGYSPTGRTYDHVPTRYLEAIEEKTMPATLAKLQQIATYHNFHSYVSGSSLMVVIPYSHSLGFVGEDHLPVKTLAELLAVLGY